MLSPVDSLYGPPPTSAQEMVAEQNTTADLPPSTNEVNSLYAPPSVFENYNPEPIQATATSASPVQVTEASLNGAAVFNSMNDLYGPPSGSGSGSSPMPIPVSPVFNRYSQTQNTEMYTNSPQEQNQPPPPPTQQTFGMENPMHGTNTPPESVAPWNTNGANMNSFNPTPETQDSQGGTSQFSPQTVTSSAAYSATPVYNPPPTQDSVSYSSFSDDADVVDLYSSGPPKASAQIGDKFRSTYGPPPPLFNEPNNGVLGTLEEQAITNEPQDSSSSMNLSGVFEEAPDLWAKAEQFAKERLDTVEKSKAVISEKLENVVQDVKSKNPLDNLALFSNGDAPQSIPESQQYGEMPSPSGAGMQETESTMRQTQETQSPPADSFAQETQEQAAGIGGNMMTPETAPLETSPQTNALYSNTIKENHSGEPRNLFRNVTDFLSQKIPRGEGGEMAANGSVEPVIPKEPREEPRNILRNVTEFFSPKSAYPETQQQQQPIEDPQLQQQQQQRRGLGSLNPFQNNMMNDFSQPPTNMGTRSLQENNNLVEDPPLQNGLGGPLNALAASLGAVNEQRKKAMGEFLSEQSGPKQAMVNKSRNSFTSGRGATSVPPPKGYSTQADVDNSGFNVFRKDRVTPPPPQQRQSEQPSFFGGLLRTPNQGTQVIPRERPRATNNNEDIPPAWSLFYRRPSSGTFSLTDGLTTEQKEAVKQRQQELKKVRQQGRRSRATYSLKVDPRQQQQNNDRGGFSLFK